MHTVLHFICYLSLSLSLSSGSTCDSAALFVAYALHVVLPLSFDSRTECRLTYTYIHASTLVCVRACTWMYTFMYLLKWVGSGVCRAFYRKHYLITSNLKSNCVVLLSILLLVSAFGWILFIRFTYIHTHTCAAHTGTILICSYTHTRTYVCILLFRFFFACVSRFLYLLATAQLFFFVLFHFPHFSFALLYVNVDGYCGCRCCGCFYTTFLFIDNIEILSLVSHFIA